MGEGQRLWPGLGLGPGLSQGSGRRGSQKLGPPCPDAPAAILGVGESYSPTSHAPRTPLLPAAGLPKGGLTPPGVLDPQSREGAKPHPRNPSPGDLRRYSLRIDSPPVRSGVPHVRPKCRKCHPGPWYFQDPCYASPPPPDSGSRTSGTCYLPPATTGPELRGSSPLSLALELRGPLPPFHPQVWNFGVPSRLPSTLGPEFGEPGVLCPPRPRLRNFGVPVPSQALELRGSLIRPQPPYSELRGPPSPVPSPRTSRPQPPAPSAGSAIQAHPDGSAPRKCPGARRVRPHGADSPKPGAPLARWLRGPRPPRRPPHRPRLCLRRRRRPRRLRSHRGRSRRGRRPPRLPGRPRPSRSAPCRPSAARGRGRGGSREEVGRIVDGILRWVQKGTGDAVETETQTQRQRDGGGSQRQA